MKIRAYIIFLLCLFQVSIYAQKTAQVTLTIRLHPIQTIEIVDDNIQKLEVSIQSVESDQCQEHSGIQQLSTFSTSKHSTHIDSVKCKGFEALRAIRDLPPIADKSINHIFSDESFYFKDGDEDELHVVYCMETL